MSFASRVAASVLFVLWPVSAQAFEFWWVAGPEDDKGWWTAENWIDEDDNLNEEGEAPPNTHGGQQVSSYISTSDELVTIDPVAEFDSTQAETDHPLLYIGGWAEESDAVHGDPQGHYGQLDILSGALTSAGVSGGPPHCNYLRLGTRGAQGVVNQSGGTYRNCTTVTMAYEGDSVGVWNLSGGMVEVDGFQVGGQGSGIVNMSGGTFTNDDPGNSSQLQCVASSTVKCATTVGAGVTHVDGPALTGDVEPYVAGTGLFDVSGGTVSIEQLAVARNVGSTGIFAVRGTADVTISDAAFVGYYGFGSLLQSGGTATYGKLYAGYFPGSIGSYTHSGGTMTADEFRLGGPNDVGNMGVGLAVVSDGRLHVRHYEQKTGTRITFVVGADSQNGKFVMRKVGANLAKAEFRTGSKVEIAIANTEKTGAIVPGNEDTPACAAEFVLFHVEDDPAPGTDDGIRDAAGLGDPPNWDLQVHTNQTFEGVVGDELVAKYCPSGCSCS